MQQESLVKVQDLIETTEPISIGYNNESDTIQTVKLWEGPPGKFKIFSILMKNNVDLIFKILKLKINFIIFISNYKLQLIRKQTNII